MRRRTLPVIALCLLLAGCAAQNATTQPSTEIQRLSLATEAYTVGLGILNDLKDAGVIDAKLYAQIEPARAAVAAALDSWQANLGKPAAQQAEAEVLSALPQLLRYATLAKKAAPTTQPGH